MTERSGAADRPRTVLLALGSNIDPEVHLFAALDALDEIFGIEAASAIYEADPVGAPGTPAFLNAAVRIRTTDPPGPLKREILRPLEARLGRTRGPDRNAPRTIDIDVALVDGWARRAGAAEPELPDPEIVERAHLALPLADVASELVHPDEGVTLGEIAGRFADADGIRRRDDLRWPRP